MIPDEVVDLSRLQFAVTALYHFLFVPLTLGLSFIMAIMESVYVMTGKLIYRDMTQFWGKLFGINFAMGVATGITLEFQFGTNWAYFSHYVGDIFGVSLAIQGLMGFFLTATFIGLFFFGWERLGKRQHLLVTWLLALGSSLSAAWILIANGWMQNPVGSEFNLHTMRMELTSFADLVLNPVAQVKFVHTVAAGYVTGSVFVLGISAYYLLKGRDLAFAQRSFAVAAGFGFASALSVIVLGDESGYTTGAVQQVKLAAVEAQWETHEPPAAFTVFGIPDQEAETTHYALRIPWVLGLIATRSIDEPILGIKELREKNAQRIRLGLTAYGLFKELREGRGDRHTRDLFEARKQYLGYGLLLKKYTPNVVDATDEQIQQAAQDTIPRVAPLFWSFRIMVAAGFWILFIFAMAVYYSARRQVIEKRWFLRMALWSIPLPWIAGQAGWIVAEYGRQPWSIAEVLPTALSTSTRSAGDLYFSLSGLLLFYTFLLVAELYLMFKYARMGPSSLSTGRYALESDPPISGSVPVAPPPKEQL